MRLQYHILLLLVTQLLLLPHCFHIYRLHPEYDQALNNLGNLLKVIVLVSVVIPYVVLSSSILAHVLYAGNKQIS